MLQATVNGLVLGSAYALVALGLVFLYKNTSFINFAHGDLVTVGAFLGFALLSDGSMPLPLALSILVASMFVIGLVVQRIVAGSVKRKSILVGVITSLGIGIAARAILQLVWGSADRRLDPLAGDAAVQYFGIGLDASSISILITVCLVLTLLVVIYQGTFLGVQLRAVAFDPEMARLMGVNVRLIIAASFGVSAVLAGLAGLLLGPQFFVSLGLGWAVGLKAIVAAIVGGFGSLRGAVVGGLLVGLLEIWSATLLSPDFREPAIYGLLILVLLVRPAGIFGSGLEQKV